MNELMTKLMAYDWGGDRGVLMGIDALIVAAQGDKAKLAEIELALLEVLRSEARLPAKEYVCRQLALIGTEASVPPLAGMLGDADLSDRARYALEAMPGVSVDEALRAALNATSGIQRVGVVNTLGERRDKQAVSVLIELRDDPDSVMANAAAAALRKIGPVS